MGKKVLVDRELLECFVDNDSCELDHHGYCQTHGWFDSSECHVSRLRKVLEIPQEDNLLKLMKETLMNVRKNADKLEHLIDKSNTLPTLDLKEDMEVYINYLQNCVDSLKRNNGKYWS